MTEGGAWGMGDDFNSQRGMTIKESGFLRVIISELLGYSGDYFGSLR